MALQIDSEFRDLLPPLTPDEYATLESNLKRDGCLFPLVVWGETLIDGHNRYEICTRLGIPYEVQKIHLESRIEALEWIISHQDGQRAEGWNKFTRSESVLRCKTLIEKIRQDAQERIKSGTANPSHKKDGGRTDERLGKLADVSRSTIRKAQAIIETAPPVIVDLARKGEISTSKAYELTKVLDGASEKVTAIVETYQVTDVNTVKRLADLHPSSETLQDVLATGYIDTGDSQVHVTDSPVAVDKAIAKRADAHRQLARESKDYRTNPNRRDLILYNTGDLAQTARTLIAHYGDTIELLISELTNRQNALTKENR